MGLSLMETEIQLKKTKMPKEIKEKRTPTQCNNCGVIMNTFKEIRDHICKKKIIKAWAIVNKDFEKIAKISPSILTGEIYLIKNKADEKVKESASLKVVPCEIKILCPKKK